MNENDFKNRLVEFLSADERIPGIGQTEDVNAPLVPGKSDIDMLVLCSVVLLKLSGKKCRAILKKSLTQKTTATFQAVSAWKKQLPDSKRNLPAARVVF